MRYAAQSWDGGWGLGVDLVLTLPGCVCPKVCVLFRLQGSKMSEKISLEMGIKLAASLSMGENLCRVLYIITYKSGENELQST